MHYVMSLLVLGYRVSVPLTGIQM